MLFLHCVMVLHAQRLAFPGAEGYAAFATGGRGGEVVHVTNLKASGAGSLADAVSQPNRIIVFDVGGVIDITGSSITLHNNQTIAGQTAPGEGVTIYGGRVIASNCSNIIMRYVRMRGGISLSSSKCTLTMDNASNVILDHCTISWGRWDNVHITNASNITWQYCIVSEGIDPQRFGAITDGTYNWTVSHCLWMNNKSRNPKMKCAIQYYNNVVYNYGSGIVGGHSAGNNYQDVINNYFIGGPSNGTTGKYFDQWTSTDHLYSAGNYHDNNKDGVLNGELITDYNEATPMLNPNFSCPGPNFIETAEEAYHQIVEHVGASRVRDSHDRRLIEQLTSLGAKGSFIDSESDVGGIGTVAGGTPPADTDGDGMPDEWETENGLNPMKNDASGDIHDDGYSNIETYINSLTQKSSYLMSPANLRARLADEVTVRLTWTNMDDSATGIVVEQSTDNIYFNEILTLSADSSGCDVEGLVAKKIYYFRVKAVNDNNASLYSEVVAVNDEGIRAGGGTPGEETAFVPSADKYYRIINYGTVAFNSGTTLGGNPKYLCFNSDSALASTESFEYDNPAILWEITPVENGAGNAFYIKNKATGTYLSEDNVDFSDRARVMSSANPAVFTINYTSTESASQSGVSDKLSFFRINNPKGSQIRAYNFENCWLWGSGSITRADMIFTFSEIDKSMTSFYLSKLRNLISEARLEVSGATVGDMTLSFPADEFMRLSSIINDAESFLENLDSGTTIQAQIDAMVDNLSKVLSEFKSSRIYTFSGYDTSYVYCIYTYGQYSNSSATTATLLDPRRYLTAIPAADEQNDSLVFTIGLTEQDFLAEKEETVLQKKETQWQVTYGDDGVVFFKNRQTGGYLQVGNILSRHPASIYPYYAKEDNGHHAYYLETSPTNTRSIMVGTPDTWDYGDYGPLKTGGPVDRTRMRWVIEPIEGMDIMEEGLPGDVNEDGEVNINDVVAIINVMAGTASWANANVNGDSEGNVDINDVVAVINIMAGN